MVHRDLKLENILLDDNCNIKVKLRQGLSIAAGCGKWVWLPIGLGLRQPLSQLTGWLWEKLPAISSFSLIQSAGITELPTAYLTRLFQLGQQLTHGPCLQEAHNLEFSIQKQQMYFLCISAPTYYSHKSLFQTAYEMGGISIVTHINIGTDKSDSTSRL